MTARETSRQQLGQEVFYEQTDQHVRLSLPADYVVLSSAVFNGGFTQADSIINIKVPKSLKAPDSVATPEQSLAAYVKQVGCNGNTVGMMTAASMDSLAVATEEVEDEVIAVLVTSGLSNPRRAGDPADYPHLSNEPPEPGTINTIIYSSLPLTRAAMVEAIMIATEAKATVLQDFAVLSPVSQAIATGTGTDSVALACASGPSPLHYAGKHVRFGEVVARLVIKALSASIRWEYANEAEG